MRSVILVGGGTSVRQGIELDLWNKIRGFDVWSLNYAYKTMPYIPSKQVWVDVGFFRLNTQDLEQLYKTNVSCVTKSNHVYSFISEIKQYDTTRDINEVDKKVYIGRMGLVGFFGLSLAIKENYDIIYLLGYDFGTVGINDRDTHYYQNTIQVESNGIGRTNVYRLPNGEFKREIQDFEIYLKYPNKIYNVSPSSNINCFEKINYTRMFELLNE